MNRSRLGALVVLVSCASLVHAASLEVHYLVDAKPLKRSAVAGTPLTFTLFSDPLCSAQVASQVVPIENVLLIEQLKALVPKGAPKGPHPARLSVNVTGLAVSGSLFLKVTGAGVEAIGGDCQPQGFASAGLTTPVLKDATGATIGPVLPDPAMGGVTDVVLSLPDGLIAVQAFSYGLGSNNQPPFLQYATSDCTGAALVEPDPFSLIRHPLAQVGSVVYFAPRVGANQPVGSVLQNGCAPTCTIRPGGLCCCPPANLNPYVGPADTLDTSTYTSQPYRAELQ